MVYLYKGVLFSHKRTEILTFETIWMELESKILSKISWSEQDKDHMILVICETQKTKQMSKGTKKERETTKETNSQL